MKKAISLNSRKAGALVSVLVFGLAAVCPSAEDAWTYKADITTARTWFGGCVLDGKIYAIGGGRSDSSATSAVEVYDPVSNTWTRMANIPSARCCHATCTFEGKIYTFGGGPGVWSLTDKKVFLYNPQTNTWTQKADMPYAIGSSGIVVVDNMIYLIGGTLSASSTPVRRVMAYDPVTESWTQMADLPTARELLSACVVDGKIYAIGGCKENWQTFAYKIVEVYDPSTDTWTSRQDMPTERWSLGACVVKGSIYAIGGCSNGLQPSTANEVYDPATDTWTTKAPMQQKRLGHFVGLVGDKIYAIGGHYPNLNMVSRTEEYDTGLGVPSPDFNGDGVIDSADMCIMVDHWGEDYPPCDIAPTPFGDGVVNVQDLIVLAEHLFEEVFPIELAAYWKLDETECSIAHESVADNHGTVYGEPLWQPEGGKKDGAMTFDGIDDYVEAGFVLDPAGGTFSVLAWIQGGSSGQVILSQTDGTGSGETWLGTTASEGNLMTGLVPPQVGRSAVFPLESQSLITDGQWHHVGFVWDGEYRILYVDGTEVAKDAMVQKPLKSATGGMIIGAGKNLEAGNFFSGLIDDVCIYNMALTAEQITALAQ
ncbi:MAG: hypothetical protein JXA81_05485 [Sedimentisphaerales bacterium]|nr:hypothetical protein [Sedimentisphaerales bacterium]